jgi:L-ribulose-5-phosphate 3-epimerase UlaE
LKLVSATAQTAGMILSIEGHVLSPLDSAMQVRHLLDAVASPALKFNLDAVNFIGSVRDVHNPTPFINELLNLLGQDIVAAHIKDCALEDELVLHIKEVVVGTGVIDHTKCTASSSICPMSWFPRLVLACWRLPRKSISLWSIKP